MTNSKEEVCPFQWGDRVDHRIFGLGMVNGEPRAVCGPAADHRRVESKGWNVPVEWDDASRTAGSVASSFLRLVDRPNAKGGAYWRAEYAKLADNALKARAAVNIAISHAFRPVDGTDSQELKSAMRTESECLSALITFLEADERGEHA